MIMSVRELTLRLDLNVSTPEGAARAVHALELYAAVTLPSRQRASYDNFCSLDCLVSQARACLLAVNHGWGSPAIARLLTASDSDNCGNTCAACYEFIQCQNRFCSCHEYCEYCDESGHETCRERCGCGTYCEQDESSCDDCENTYGDAAGCDRCSMNHTGPVSWCTGADLADDNLDTALAIIAHIAAVERYSADQGDVREPVSVGGARWGRPVSFALQLATTRLESARTNYLAVLADYATDGDDLYAARVRLDTASRELSLVA
jgi:hypothetical protein